MIHIYTGEAKGKTTAAVGLAIRALGAGKKVLWMSYFKPEGSSEHEVLEKLGVTFEELKLRGDFFKKYSKEDLEKAKKDFDKFFEKMQAKTAEHEMIVHDEVVYALHMGLVDDNKILGYLKMFKDREIVLTGRNFTEEFVGLADYVTEMNKIKHPFDKGAGPREGVEY